MNNHAVRQLLSARISSGRVRNGLCLLFAAAWAFFAPAQPATPQSSNSQQTDPRDEVIRQLLKRVESLENEMQSMKAAIPPAKAEPAATAELTPLPPVVAEQRPRYPDLAFHGFGDFDYHVSDRRDDHNSFSLGTLDLFFTSRLAEDLSVLGEIAVEAGEENSMGIDLERFMLQYTPSEYFNLAIGRYHTAIGYYSTAYHHGTWFQTATGRSLIYAFEDGGGPLPIHNVGLSASGRIPSGSLGLHYVAEIGNGRNYDPAKEAVLNVADDNSYKAINLALFATPEWCQGLQFGVSAYHDTVTLPTMPRVDQLILAGHVIYKTPQFEWLNEGVLMRDAPDGGSAHNSPAFYTQVARQFGKFRPYIRYQYLNGSASDPILGLVGAQGVRHGPSAGLRFDFADFAAFKAQYNHLYEPNASVNELVLQACFTF